MKQRYVVSVLTAAVLLVSMTVAGCKKVSTLPSTPLSKVTFEYPIIVRAADDHAIPLKKGDAVPLGTRLFFSVEDTYKLEKDHTYGMWTVNGKDIGEVKVDNGRTELPLSVSYVADKDETKVAFTTREKKDITVIFDSTKMTVGIQDDPSRPWSSKQIPSAQKLKEGSVLLCEATLPKGKQVKHWTVNGLVQPDSRKDDFLVSLKALNIKEDKTEIAYEMEDAKEEKIVLTFKEQELTCIHNASTSNTWKIKSGDEVSITDRLSVLLSVDPLSYDRTKYTHAEFYANGVKLNERGTDRYELRTEYALEKDGKKTIELTRKLVEVKALTVSFDTAKMRGVLNNKTLTGTTAVKDGDRISFTAWLKNDEKVAYWTVNGEKQQYSDNQLSWSYSVNADHADKDGKLRVDYVTGKEVPLSITYKVTYEADKLQCAVPSGTEMVWKTDADDKTFTFRLKNVNPAEYKGIVWQVNGRESRFVESDQDDFSTFELRVEKNQLLSAKILDGGTREFAIGFTLVEKNHKYTVTFDPAKVKISASSLTPEAQDKLYAVGASLTLEAISIPDGHIVDYWTVNGNKKSGWTTYTYTVSDSDGSVTISYVTKKIEPPAPSPTYTVSFGDGIACKKKENLWSSDYTINVATDDKVETSDSLQFTATVPDGKTVSHWTINGVRQADSDNAVLLYRVKSDDSENLKFVVEAVFK